MLIRGTERTKGWRMPELPKREVERMLSERRSFGVIEDRIDRMAVTDDLKAALWLLAWSDQAVAERRRTIDEALMLASKPRG
jgi:hypothetical protein